MTKKLRGRRKIDSSSMNNRKPPASSWDDVMLYFVEYTAKQRTLIEQIRCVHVYRYVFVIYRCGLEGQIFFFERIFAAGDKNCVRSVIADDRHGNRTSDFAQAWSAWG